ncbi:MAG: AraC family transcriptional regulator [Clostridia bacterium]|nr:AraC family transcriptional regulator [Clostridia bacterium]
MQFGIKRPYYLHYFHRRDQNPTPSDFARHCHDGYELVHVVQGYGRFIVEGEAYDVKPGSVLFFRPYEYHYVDIRSDSPYERQVFNFKRDSVPAELGVFLDLLGRSAPGEGNYYAESDLPEEFFALLRGFDAVTDLPKEQQKVFLRTRLSDLIVMVATTESRSGTSISERLGARVVRYLNGHIDTDETLDDLARRFTVSKFYMCRSFKEHNGISIHGYLTRKRIMIAKSKIESGTPAVTAAAEVGFGDYSAFFRAYRRIVGHSPRET